MKNDLQFQIFETMQSKKNDGLKSLPEILNKIKNGDDKTPFIKAIREAGEQNEFYEIIKSKREAIAWNVTFGEGKKEGDIEAMTGVVCMSKNNISNEQIKAFKSILMTLPYVIAVWVSFDGNGIECLVKCYAVNPSNFTSLLETIENEIGFKFDENSRSVKQLSLVSFDPDIRINSSAVSFSFSETIPIKACKIPGCVAFSEPSNDENMELPKVQYDLLYLKEYDRIAPSDYDYSNSRIRYQTEFHDRIFGDKEYRTFSNGVPFHQINTYYKVLDEKRNPTMSYQAAKLVFLNPGADKEFLTELLFEINRYQCQPKLSFGEIKNILNIQYKRMQEGKLKITPGTRKIVYKTSCNLGLKEKRKLNGAAVGWIKRSNILKLMKGEILKLMEVGQVIHQKHIAEKTGRCIRTIKQHWKHFKEDVTSHNNTLSTI